MKSPKQMTPHELGHAAQIGGLLTSTAASAGQSSDPDRQAAAEWWARHLETVIAKSGFKQAER